MTTEPVIHTSYMQLGEASAYSDLSLFGGHGW